MQHLMPEVDQQLDQHSNRKRKNIKKKKNKIKTKVTVDG
jgi:hypothetical protein